MKMKPIILGMTILLLSSAVQAAGGPAAATFEEANKDPDFALQGEYTGKGVGIQVIALSKGQFRIVEHQGGLPGDGWDKSDKTETEVNRDKLKSRMTDWKKVSRKSETIGMKPPEGAVVLFDGTEESMKAHWKPGAKMTEDGLLMQGITSIDTYKDATIHLEFRLPYMPESRGQGRGNSGFYMQGRYEVQMLDSFGLAGKDNECGGIYKAAAPDVNMCYPPLRWQTYDIEFTAAKYEDGKKVKNAIATVKHNGIVIHKNLEIPSGTPGGPVNKEEDTAGPVFLQNHNNPVRYRNIWFKSK